MDIDHLFRQYDAVASEVHALEQKLALAKERRSALAELVKSNYGAGPHDKGGKQVIVANKGDAFFLRPPLVGRKKPKLKSNPTEETS